MTCFCTIPSVHSLIRIWGDMILMIENLEITLLFIISEIKILIIWWKKQDISTLVNMIATDWTTVKNEADRSVMLKWAQTSRTVTTCAYVGVLGSVGTLLAPTMFGTSVRSTWNITDPGRPMLFQTYYIFDVGQSPYFEITFALQVIGIVTGALLYSAVDTFLGLLIFHICGQLEKLQRQLAKETCDFEYALKCNVKEHVRIIRSVNILENTFALMLLILLIVFSLTFCAYGVLLINGLEGDDESTLRRMFLVVCILTVFAHMCLYCAVGELLIIKNESLYSAIYEFKWYSKGPRFTRNLMLLLLRTKKPLNISAGKMFPMTMATFCDLLKTSAGYISVLLAKQDV